MGEDAAFGDSLQMSRPVIRDLESPNGMMTGWNSRAVNEGRV